MDSLDLIPLAGDDPKFPPNRRLVWVGIGESSHGCAISERILRADAFTSVHEFERSLNLQESGATPRLTRENPFLTPEELAGLDTDGLILEGRRVEENSVLASMVKSAIGKSGPVADGMEWVTDESLRATREIAESVVTSVRRIKGAQTREQAEANVRETIEIVLQARRQLQIGDVLFIGAKPVEVSSFFAEPLTDCDGNKADVLLPKEIGIELRIVVDRYVQKRVAKADALAADSVHARSDGPYSLISLTPLKNPRVGGLPICEEHIRWLGERSLTSLIREFVAVKSDDLANRHSIQRLATAQTEGLIQDLAPAAPESLANIVTHITALGLNFDPRDCDGHVSLGFRFASADDIRSQSGGVVTKPETINYRTYRDEKDGLFGPNIFGKSDESRRRTFGHIELIAPIVPILFRLGSPSLVEMATGLSADDIENVLFGNSELLVADGSLEVVEPGTSDETDEERHFGKGARAIQRAAKWRASQALAVDVQNAIPFLVAEVVPVIPPDWRPLILLDSGNFGTSDLNDHYRRVINRNNRLRKLQDFSAPRPIIDNEIRALQQTVDALHANKLLPRAIVGQRGKLADLLDQLHKSITLRTPKYVDFCGSARLIVDAKVPNDRIHVPKRIWETLRLEESSPVLLTIADGDGSFVSRFPSPSDLQVIGISPETFEQFGMSESAAITGHLHRPVSEAGRADAFRLLRGDFETSDKRFKQSDGESWLSIASKQELAKMLVSAAVTGESLPLDTPWGLMLGGLGSTYLAPDSRRGEFGAETRLAPKPS